MSDGAFPRWMLPLAAGLSLAVGAFWWTITIRHETPRPSVLQDNGREWVIGADPPPILPNLPRELRTVIAETLRTGQLPVAPVRGDSNESFKRWRSKPKAFQVLGPSGTAVPYTSPLFSWTPAKGADAYRIHLREKAEGSRVRDVETPATTTEWLPSAGSLRTGAEYEWGIEALAGGKAIAWAPQPQEPKVSFRVLSEEKRSVWERERTVVGNSHLLRGIAAARAGLLEEAATEFRALGRQNPRAERARLLLEQVQAKNAR